MNPADTDTVAGPAPEAAAVAAVSLARAATGLGLLRDVPVEISVEIGKTHMRLADVYEMAVGQVIELDRPVGAPVDIVANDQVVIARGEVVEIGDEYGVRITEIVAGDA
jgi:flagellar motor switch protein FliN/FliY